MAGSFGVLPRPPAPLPMGGSTAAPWCVLHIARAPPPCALASCPLSGAVRAPCVASCGRAAFGLEPARGRDTAPVSRATTPSCRISNGRLAGSSSACAVCGRGRTCMPLPHSSARSPCARVGGGSGGLSSPRGGGIAPPLAPLGLAAPPPPPLPPRSALPAASGSERRPKDEAFDARLSIRAMPCLSDAWRVGRAPWEASPRRARRLLHERLRAPEELWLEAERRGLAGVDGADEPGEGVEEEARLERRSMRATSPNLRCHARECGAPASCSDGGSELVDGRHVEGRNE
mmetsp:Transcript_28836/g.78442  ORF Transcript_28836/g.78442 Transcript_28836/m.78442 type:complete len:289 (-) Transcript_28836:51-917(-)